MKAGTSEEAVKAGTGTRTNASVVYNGYTSGPAWPANLPVSGDNSNLRY